MCFGCSKELSHRDGSFEFQQHLIWLRNKKNNSQLRTLIWGPVLKIHACSFFFHTISGYFGSCFYFIRFRVSLQLKHISSYVCRQQLYSQGLTLIELITTKVVCFCRPLKGFRNLFDKQYIPRSDGSSRSSLIKVHTICFYTFISHLNKKCCRRLKQTAVSDGFSQALQGLHKL